MHPRAWRCLEKRRPPRAQNYQVESVNGHRKYRFRGNIGGEQKENLQMGRNEFRRIKNKGRENSERNLNIAFVWALCS